MWCPISVQLSRTAKRAEWTHREVHFGPPIVRTFLACPLFGVLPPLQVAKTPRARRATRGIGVASRDLSF